MKSIEYAKVIIQLDKAQQSYDEAKADWLELLGELSELKEQVAALEQFKDEAYSKLRTAIKEATQWAKPERRARLTLLAGKPIEPE